MERPFSVLIVDDDEGMCETLADVLLDKGHEVAIAKSGEEAVQLFRRQQFDLVLMDVKMPGMNGVDTLKCLNQMKGNVKVLMMTAYAVDDRLEEALREGAIGVAYKPLDLGDLLNTIRKVTTEPRPVAV
jgi:CheY-like chemotaxis protein